jgi:transcriptional regulator with XRE-family HTH domain
LRRSICIFQLIIRPESAQVLRLTVQRRIAMAPPQQVTALRKTKRKYTRRRTAHELEERATIYQFLGRRLRFLRETEARLSQGELGARIGVSFQQVQKYESGANKISIDTLLLFAKLIGRDLNYLLDGIGSIALSVEALPQDDASTVQEALKLVKMFSSVKDKDIRDAIMRFMKSLSHDPQL